MANYLYNGVELPDISTVWTDKETYPYASISVSGDMRVLTLRTSTVYIHNGCMYRSAAGTKLDYTLEDGAWVFDSETPYEADSRHLTGYYWTHWTSVDILNTDDGTVWLAASDPVPVGGEPTTAVYMDIGGERKKVTAYKDIGGVRRKISEAGASLPAVGTSLEDCTWEQISAISAAGKAAEYFSVGDTKSVYLKGTVGTLALDTTLYVYILGFDHNSEIEGKGITFGTFKTADGVDVALIDSKYNSAYSNGTKCFNMNHWGNYNYGGWAGCDMRYDILGSTDNAPSGYGASPASGRTGYDPSATCATNPVANTLMAALPADLRSVIKPMTKYTNNTGASGDTEAKVTVTTDYLPLLAEFEIFGARTYANSYEQNKQKQYDYYAAGNSKQKYRHSATSSTAVWWERSAYCYGNTDDRTNFCCVSKSSNAGNSSAYSVFGIAPIFLV